MSGADWQAYAGMVTGVFATVMSVLAYRRTSTIKKLDLRLEVRKSLASAHAQAADLDSVMATAARAHPRSLTAQGLSNSGSAVAWRRELDADLASALNLKTEIGPPDNTYQEINAAALESEIVRLHALGLRIDALTRKYNAQNAADAEGVRNRAQAASNALRTQGE